MTRFWPRASLSTGCQAYHAALNLADAGHRLAKRLPRGHGGLAHAGRTVALLTGLVRKFA